MENEKYVVCLATLNRADVWTVNPIKSTPTGIIIPTYQTNIFLSERVKNECLKHKVCDTRGEANALAKESLERMKKRLTRDLNHVKDALKNIEEDKHIRPPKQEPPKIDGKLIL